MLVCEQNSKTTHDYDDQHHRDEGTTDEKATTNVWNCEEKGSMRLVEHQRRIVNQNGGRERERERAQQRKERKRNVTKRPLFNGVSFRRATDWRIREASPSSVSL